jgi:cobalt-zinc-cadmium efflux system protein
MLTDAAALALAWAAFRFGQRKRDERRSFGYLRFEILAGFINALTLIVLVGWIAYEAVLRIINPTPILAGPMLVIACVGLAVNAGVLWMLMKGDRDHVNIRGAMLHVLGDFLGSVAAIAAAIAIYFTGWTPIDPILSLLLSAIVLRSAWVLLKSTLHILMEGTPQGVVVSEMRETLTGEVDGVVDLHHVHVWSITSGKPSATLEVQIAEGADPARVVRAIKAKLASAYGIVHSTVEIDWDHERRDCALEADGGHGRHHHDHGHRHDHDHEHEPHPPLRTRPA